MQRVRFNQQYQNNDTFFRPSVVNAQGFNGSEKYPDSGINCNYSIDQTSQAYGEIVSCFRPLGKDFITSNI